MIGDKSKEIIANTLKFVSVSRTLPISLSANYVHELEYMTKQPGVYQTDFVYTIRYAPASTFKKHDGKPYLIKIDFFDTIQRECHRFKNYEDFVNNEKFKHTIPFLLKYTSISPKLFEIAKKNLYCDIPIQFDFMRYISDVEEKYKQEHNGEEIEDFIFLSEHTLIANAFLNEEKIEMRKSSKDGKNKIIEGVVEK